MATITMCVFFSLIFLHLFSSTVCCSIYINSKNSNFVYICMFYTYKLCSVRGTNKNCRVSKEQDSATKIDIRLLTEENKTYNKTQSHSALYYSKKHSNEITQWYWWNKSVGARFKGCFFSPCYLRKLD